MKKIVLIVNGNPGSGKSTVENMIAEIVPSIIHSSISLVKNIAVDYFDWDYSKDTESRKFLSDMKTFLNKETDLIEKDLLSKYEEFGYSDAKILMIDIREVDEIKKYAEKFDAKTLLIENPRISINKTNKSDAQVKNLDYDYILNNNGDIDCLQSTVKQFLKVLNKTNKPKLYFQDSLGINTFLKEVESIEDADKEIQIFLNERNYISSYHRYWIDEDDNVKIDVGSHTEYFIVTGIKELFKYKCKD